ncbi:ABC transporter ATP-binding protein [Pseudogemmobacter humi]|uniref:Spermidine/putrescine import ATP-binding protein PotA n=1 Tax=Pseudogemmobacter humi TaxID=2483812 RepID=A0A3P5XFN6_9RHOB|nr:ABC transporter ATP-binding protein [Pseudogemmobacter humi]VDC33642.1 Spermidine/putrescine import ATP-binding protein PotA [Pseudogemmobacter humi]
MAGLKIDGVTRRFGEFEALKQVTLEIGNGEFVAVLGPSGCGKTTLLRAIAGFEKISEGSITVGGAEVSGPGRHVPPEARNVGIVFQNYALWPHMSVAENVGYALKVAKVPRAERGRRVQEALDLVDLGAMGERRPANLSGGQRQRVALARCLVATPSLVLFDEPLANLDVHLRAAMEAEFADFHKRTGTTIVYITHDQAEAVALADRIAVMDHGRLIQFATPQELYARPANAMVAHFIANGIVLPATVLGEEQAGKVLVDVLGEQVVMDCPPGTGPRPAGVCLRPADLRLADSGGIGVAVKRAVYRGGGFRIEGHPVLRPDLEIGFDLPDPARLAAGEVARLAITGGWVLPAGQE